MSRDRFQKYLWIIDRLYRSGGMSYRELADEWKYSSLNSSGSTLPKRTFDVYRRAIEETFDINIICNASNGYRYSIEQTDDLQRHTVKNWLLSSFAVNNIIQESRKLKARILFDRIPSGNELLMTIIEAMQRDRTLLLTYQSFHHDHPNTFEAEPYCVKVSRQRWYLLARIEEAEALHIYALDRMKKVEITDKPFEMPPAFDAEAYFADCIGITMMPEELAVETIRLKVFDHSHKCKYLRSLPLHASQLEVERQAGYSVFEYRLYPTYEFFQEVLSHGAEVEVLSPQWVRNDLKKMVEEMGRLYGDR